MPRFPEPRDFNAGPSLCAMPECRKDATNLCSRCKGGPYCSKECQTAHWKEHKQECR